MNPKCEILQEISGSIAGYDKSYKVKILDGHLKNCILTFQGFVSGCGVCIVGSLTNYSLIKIKECQDLVIRKEMIDELKEVISTFGNPGTYTGAGAILATLGSTYYTNYHDFYLELGFRQIDEYKNLAHPFNEHTQRLYSMHIPKKEKKKELPF